MRFRRKPDATDLDTPSDAGVDEIVDDAVDARPDAGPAGPCDADDLPDDDVKRVDLGALLVAPADGRELRVQVDEKSGNVRSVILAAKDGAVELRAYAAPRNGDLWSEVRPQIAADAARRGGTATENDGPFGTELHCEVQVKTADGKVGSQTSRVVGFNGPRWMLRATFLGRPARDPEALVEWSTALSGVAVRRGAQAMPVGEQLPLNLPEDVRQAQADQAAAAATSDEQPGA
ncbi:DUF3710 domain-containing protein [Nocardioides bizhenqiangii]|uniref:DUF3710 domain-containing protein n=1 Tax=Nocardioides bizhenqiangii TaxID=3095076 RepID=A0ABZ0ZKJ6_9ACTN|nr:MULTISPECIES: DUF3710 domain-containing protein [unclassified Nocardioides]MDZ5620540.1 DUF3710 domain-containing protein [Nocardioides sp. HM23]WQQ24911.1 DUF3710 domain-containing protein [Nocardioides sp. HM61]